MARHSSATFATRILTAVSLLWFAEAAPPEVPVRVTGPENGAIVNAGGAVTVTVTVPPGAYRSISIAGDGPFELSTSLSAPPYQFSYPIPADYASGRYRFHATGATESGEPVCSDVVEIDIERPDEPKKLLAEFVSLTFGDEKVLPLQIWGIFADGSKVDVTRSRRMAYTSDKPAIATVSDDGVVSAVAQGKARITARYSDKILIVPVTVTQKPNR